MINSGAVGTDGTLGGSRISITSCSARPSLTFSPQRLHLRFLLLFSQQTPYAIGIMLYRLQYLIMDYRWITWWIMLYNTMVEKRQNNTGIGFRAVQWAQEEPDQTLDLPQGHRASVLTSLINEIYLKGQ